MDLRRSKIRRTRADSRRRRQSGTSYGHSCSGQRHEVTGGEYRDDSALVRWAPLPDRMETLLQVVVTVHRTRHAVSHNVEIRGRQCGASHVLPDSGLRRAVKLRLTVTMLWEWGGMGVVEQIKRQVMGQNHVDHPGSQ